MGTPIHSLAPASDNVAVASPHIAVLLATKNGANHLEEQLDSYVAQTFENWSLHVSDDGSSDDTIDIVKRFASANGRVQTLCDGPRLGHAQNFLSLARNSSIAADYFAFSDQDDIWSPNKLERAVSSLTGISSTIPALYCSRTEIIDEHKKPLGLSPLFHKRPSFQNALVQNIAAGNTMVFNRAAKRLLESKAVGDVVTHDWWAYQIVSGVGGVVQYDPLPSVKYRQHGGNVLGANRGIRAKLLRVSKLFEGEWKGWNDRNMSALKEFSGSLSESNRVTLEHFIASRSTDFLPMRLYRLKQSGVYRQTILGNCGLIAASVMRTL
jgi:glycosyltransferase involved in cell wall biosynthesis